MTEADYRQETNEMLSRIDFVPLDVEQGEDAREFAMHIINAMIDKGFNTYNTWYAVLLDGKKMFVSFNQAGTVKMTNTKGKLVSITKKKVTQDQLFYSEFDRYKFLKLYLDEDF